MYICSLYNKCNYAIDNNKLLSNSTGEGRHERRHTDLLLFFFLNKAQQTAKIFKQTKKSRG